MNPSDASHPSPSFAAQSSLASDYIASSGNMVDNALEDLFQPFKHSASQYFQSALKEIHRLHNEAREQREQELFRQITDLQSQVMDLQDQLGSMTDHRNRLEQDLEKKRESVVTVKSRVHRIHTSTWSLKKLFLSWKACTKRSKQREKTDRCLAKWEQRHYRFKYFAILAHNHTGLRYDHRLTQEKFKFDTLSTEMVMQYENEQSRLNQDLHDAYQLIKKEEMKRIQLEEEMRRMFLKNMTAMNKEALNIFNQVNKADPTDVLASMGFASPSRDDNSAEEKKATAVPSSASFDPYGMVTPVTNNSGSSAVRFDFNSPAPYAPPPSSYSDYHPQPQPQQPQQQKESVLSTVQDRGYLDKLSELYRTNTASSSKLANNSPAPLPDRSSGSKGGSTLQQKGGSQQGKATATGGGSGTSSRNRFT